MECVETVGRCVALSLLGSTWASSHSYFGFNAEQFDMDWEKMIAQGAQCSGEYCKNMRLIFMGVQVDGAKVVKSDWISDNTGYYSWFTGSDDVRIASCPNGTAVSKIQCDGSYCRNIR